MKKTSKSTGRLMSQRMYETVCKDRLNKIDAALAVAATKSDIEQIKSALDNAAAKADIKNLHDALVRIEEMLNDHDVKLFKDNGNSIMIRLAKLEDAQLSMAKWLSRVWYVVSALLVGIVGYFGEALFVHLFKNS